MDESLSLTWLGLCLFAFTHGLRHGMDGDHLATIDGLARRNAVRHPRLALFTGTLFSLGHGFVIVLVAIGAATLANRWQVPGWLEISGAAISVVFLLGLAFLNLHTVWVTPRHQMVAPTGLKSRFFTRFSAVENPFFIAAIGMLFALSFDTITQATLFAVAANRFGGVTEAVLLAGCFVFGMMLTDGLNSIWVTRLIRRADRHAVMASRIMATAVGVVSLAIGGLTLFKLVLPSLEEWTDTRGLWIGFGVVAAVTLAFVAAMRTSAHVGHSHRVPTTAAE